MDSDSDEWYDLLTDNNKVKNNTGIQCMCHKNNFYEDNGLLTCSDCGLTFLQPVIQLSDKEMFSDCMYSIKRPKYDNKQYFVSYFKRINGEKLKEKKNKTVEEDIIKNMQFTDIGQIRKYLVKNKLNSKNDFYYWRIKNKIDKQIKASKINEIISSYIHLLNEGYRMRPKDYIYECLKTDTEYNTTFAHLFKRIKTKVVISEANILKSIRTLY